MLQQDASRRKKVTIATGCYNEVGNIRAFYERVTETMAQFPEYDYELIIRDNCSIDGTAEILHEIAANDKRVKLIFLVKNFKVGSGKVLYRYCTGDCVIRLASDLEDPPELIADFLRHWEAGKKVVVAVKAGSKEHFVMRTIRKIYYSGLNKISNIEQIKNFTGFGLYDRTVFESVISNNDPAPYLRGLISEFGYEFATVGFVKPVRPSGKSKRNFLMYFDNAMLGLTSYSKLPIHFATIAGAVLSMLSLLVAVFYFVIKMMWWPHVPFGIAPLILGMFFFASVQILFLGLIGQYVAAILVKVTPRPLPTVREFVNFSEEEIKRATSKCRGDNL